MVTVIRWTGREAKALREALRMSGRDFAHHTGLSTSSIADMEAKGDQAQLRHATQQLFDDTLASSSDEAKHRFCVILGDTVLHSPGGNGSDATVHVTADAGLPAGAAEAGASSGQTGLLYGHDDFKSSVTRQIQGDLPARTMGQRPITPTWAKTTYEAVMDFGSGARQVMKPVDASGEPQFDILPLGRMMKTATTALLSADYSRISQLLPELIGRVELAGIEARGEQQADAARLRSSAFTLAGWALIKANDPMAAWVAAEKGLRAAEQVDDLFRMATATRCVSEVYMRAGMLAEATGTALLATTYLDATTPPGRKTALCLRGAALLSASAAAARRGSEREARAAMRAASVQADQLGEDRIDFDSMFGPTNVAIHHVAVAIELGDSRQAARHIPSVDVNGIPTDLAERRARFLIDVARTYAALREDAAAEDALTEAERVAPDEVHSHRLTRDVLDALMSRERRSSGLRALARRCGLKR